MNSLSSDYIEIKKQRVQKVEWLVSNSKKFEKNLPVLDKRVELLSAISEHQVVVVTGETGSGKTTQLPQLCLELGRGSFAAIGHTQPRRISAKAVAQRLADELGAQLGQEVGYHVRFDAKYCDNTIIKVMTDGILLSEIRSDKFLSKYDTLIIDEAHERNLNTDFILGYLAKILDRRPDLKVIITSATIDSEKFAKHFDAPIVSVSGRSYKVDIKYRPIGFFSNGKNFLDEDIEYWRGGNSTTDDVDLPSAVLATVKELSTYAKGDILVFLPGERDIRDTASLLKASNLESSEIIPLYSRLSVAEQHKVFTPHKLTRIILATNIAETSLTIPNIKYVVDSGLARISRFNHKTKVQRLPIEPISKASADQRAGRCGRTSEGLCIRLYSQEDYENRPQYTEPEILRTNLASVLLHMAAIGLGNINDFPFLDQPDERSIQDGYNTLIELGAIKQEGGAVAITELGLSLSEFPMDPRMGRMLFEAIKLNCLRQIIVIVAFLSIQDPREIPSGQEEIARRHHARFADQKSDFIAIIKLWDYLMQLQDNLTTSQFRKRCKAEFLNVLRVREWQDLVSQINQICRMMRFGISNRHQPTYEEIHMAILTGFISHIGSYDTKRRIYRGVKNTSFYVSKSSFLATKKPKWIVAAGIVETSKLFAYIAAEINLSWVLKVAKEQIKYRHSLHWWDAERGESMLQEKATLYGLVLYENKLLGLRQVNFDLARSEFIRNALYKKDWETNIDVLEDIWQLLSTDVRYYDTESIKIEEEKLIAFYNKLIPKHIASGSQFQAWYKKNPILQKKYLITRTKKFIQNYRHALEDQGFPTHYSINGFRFPIVYPDDLDGSIDRISIKIPFEYLFMLSDNEFSYSIPAYREDIVRLIIKALPKNARRLLNPIEDTVREITTSINKLIDENLLQKDRNILDTVLEYIYRKYKIEVPNNINFITPLYMKFVYFIYKDGLFLESGDSITGLQHIFTRDLRDSLSKDLADHIDISEVSTWIWEAIPTVIMGKRVSIYPTLSPSHAGVKIVAVESKALQTRLMVYGIRKLLDCEIDISSQLVNKLLTQSSKKNLTLLNYTEQEFAHEIKLALIDYVVCGDSKTVFSREEYGHLLRKTVEFIANKYKSFFSTAINVLSNYSDLFQRVKNMETKAPNHLLPLILDIELSLTSLIHKGFILCSGYQDMHNLHRYLEGVRRRIELFSADPGKDISRISLVSEISTEYMSAISEFCDYGSWPPCEAPSATRISNWPENNFIKNRTMGVDIASPEKKPTLSELNSLPHESIDINHAYEMAMVHIYGRGTLSSPLSELWEIRFLIEELKVSLWAQELGTSQKVSKERIRKKLYAVLESNPL